MRILYLIYSLIAIIAFLIAGCYLLNHGHTGCGITCLIFSVFPLCSDREDD